MISSLYIILFSLSVVLQGSIPSTEGPRRAGYVSGWTTAAGIRAALQPPAPVAGTPANTIPDAPADTIPDVLPETIPVALPDTIPDVLPETIPVALPDTIPDVLPETIPVALPDTIPGAPPDTMPDPPLDPTTDTQQDPGTAQPDEVQTEVDVWPDARAPGYRTAETDSTLRWFMALDWTSRMYREPGVITYRTGQLGLPSGLDIHSYENRHQKLILNEMDVTNPVTGQINWNRVPIHKIRTVQISDRGYTHRSRVNLREYYTVQPRTYLNFDEGAGDYRSLEFSFTHNFDARTNVELAFWDRRDGDNQPRNELEGRQITMKARHNLTDRVVLKAGYVNNGLDHQRSFGYNVPDPAFYHFNPYNAQPVEPNANSNLTTNDLYAQIFRRPDENRPATAAAGLSYQTNNWSLEYSQDSTAYALSNMGAFGWQEFRAGESTHRVKASAYALGDGSGRSLTADSWFGWETALRSEMRIFPWLNGRLEGRHEGRNDDRTGYEAAASLVVEPVDWFRVEGFGGTGLSIPDLQSLYWNSIDYLGNENLAGESGFHTGVLSELQLGSHISAGMRLETRDVSDGIFPDPDGTFTNIDPYTSLSATGWLNLDSPLFEGSVSATMKDFSSASANPVNIRLDQGGTRTWVKGSFYWKNYLFERATFVKAGLSGMISPGGYLPSDYVVPLNRWHHGGAGRLLPGFHRVDVDVSARIRWFMLMLRYENVLDGVQQAGYFEADSYPMPGRRLIVALRIVFTN
ncbi:MAG: hypothetical protein WD317_04355 [Balneolaceae bacterium]